MYRGRSSVLVALLAVGGLVAAACGDDADSDASPASTTNPNSEATETDEPADTSPIVVGFHSLQGGAIALPEVITGWEVGVDYVNEVLGGINGRPLEVISCNTDGTPESSIACANEFIEGGAVAAVQGVDIGADAMLPVLAEAGLAEIGSLAASDTVRTDVGNSFFFGSPVESFNVAALLAMRDAGATKVRFMAAATSGGEAENTDDLTELGEQLDMDVQTITYDPAAPDWTSVVSTALVNDPDGIGTYAAPEPDCIGMMGAIIQTGFDGPVFAGACTAFIDVLGADAVAGTLTFAEMYTPDVLDAAPPDIAENVQTYIDLMTDAGHADLVEGFAQVGFSIAVDLADALSQIEHVDAASVLEGMPGVSGSRFMGADYACDGSAWPGTTSCSLGVLVMKVLTDGGRELVSDGFLDLSDYRPEA